MNSLFVFSGPMDEKMLAITSIEVSMVTDRGMKAVYAMTIGGLTISVFFLFYYDSSENKMLGFRQFLE